MSKTALALGLRGRGVPSLPVEPLEARRMFAAGVPAVSVTSHAVTEPLANTRTVTFTVTLDEPSASTLRLDYRTADGGATARQDYAPQAGTLTFEPGDTTRTVEVPVLADPSIESDETFFLGVSVRTGSATFADGQGTCTIFANSSQAALSSGGNLSFAARSPATFTGTNGRPVRVSLRGPGSGSIQVLDNGAAVLTLNGTTNESSLTVAGTTCLSNVAVNGSLRHFNAKASDLMDQMTVDGSLESLAFRNACGVGGVLVQAAGAVPLSIAANNLADFDLAAPAFGVVRLGRWVDSDSVPDEMSGTSVQSLHVAGTLQANLSFDRIGELAVGGAVAGADVVAASQIGAVRAGAVLDSRIVAGILGSASAGTPDAASDFTGSSRIGSLTVAGTFRNSTIAARDVGAVLLGRVVAENEGTTFGVFADRMGLIAGTSQETGGFRFRNLDAPATPRAELDFRIVAL